MFHASRTLAAAAVAAAAVLGLTGGTAVSAAAHSGSQAAPASQNQPAKRAAVCTVNDNGVNFRGGPGSQYPVLGQVNRGQKLNAHGREGSWIKGDLWGGRTGVWIHVAYLDC
ncbi:SH3 domain-containing protein [Streptomyces longisporoflavus]|uniref:SH3 domain-containing protein n=1 Tax=Streptomyces longisporoflavus TaxID=28044 RepID=A0ABW7R2V4_9ACTN